MNQSSGQQRLAPVGPATGRRSIRAPDAAFTLLELLVVVAVMAIIAALLLPALSRAKGRALAVSCLNNTRQLAVAWTMYADDHGDRLPYNLGGAGVRRIALLKTNLNWVNNVLDWSTNSDNFDPTTLTEASLGPYVSRGVPVYRCPSDQVLSEEQRAAGRTARVRSYSMNAMVGDAGEVSLLGFNINNPGYVQFFKLANIPHPSRIFVFLDEHPDSINDGYFLNKYSNYKSYRWIDLPASYHHGAGALAYADGHSELHRWQMAGTKVPARAGAIDLPADVAAAEAQDFNWVLERMSVYRD